MDKYDLRGDIARVLSAKLGSLFKDKGGMARFRCPKPGHDDSTPSAWMQDHAWGCMGCTPKAEPLRTLAELLGVPVPPSTGITLEDYATRKGFTVSNLERWGLKTVVGKFGKNAVLIPFRDASGNHLRSRLRLPTKSIWHDDGTSSHPYGLDVLAKRPADEPVIFVEGESDCHAAWHHGVLAVGIPGATAWKPAYAALAAGRVAFVWQEPGEAGVTFVASVAKDLPDVRVLSAAGVKDLADLHRAVGKEFASTVKRYMASARPASANPIATSFSPVLGGTLDEMKQRKLAPIDAVPTMLPSWNEACRGDGGRVGLARGWVTTIGGNTGQGKSLVALNCAASAIEHGEHVGFITLEMSFDELATRLLAITTGITVSELEKGSHFSLQSWDGAARAMAAIHERTGGVCHVNQKQLRTLGEVTDAIRCQHEVNGCRFIVVDYLQLVFVKGAGYQEKDILARITAVSSEVRTLAKELNVVMIGLSQFNRQTSANRNEPPMPQSLMGGSPLENDSDQVLLLDHSNYVRDPERCGAVTSLLLAKNRHGPQAAIPVRWDYRSLRLREIEETTTVKADAPPSLPSRPAVQLVKDETPKPQTPDPTLPAPPAAATKPDDYYDFYGDDETAGEAS